MGIPIRVLFDECCDPILAEALKAAGHDVAHILLSAPGTVDEMVLERAIDEQRLLVTEDKGFGARVFRLRLPVPGLVLIRMEGSIGNAKADRLLTLVREHGGDLFGRFTVLDSRRYRMRPLLRVV